MDGMSTATEWEAEAMRLEAEVAQVCGVANAAAGRLVALIADVLATGSWEGADILSPAHWVGWKCGVSPNRARRLVSMARRLHELPETRAAFEAGELSEDQVALICRHAPAAADASVAEFARHATHSQLSRVLSKYVFAADKKEPEPERRRVDFGHDDDGWWRCWGVLGSEEGAKVQRAMELERERRKLDSWADALVAVAERCLAADQASRGHHDAQTVVVHLRPDGGGHLHLGPGLPDAVLRHLGCDGRVKTVEHDHHGLAVSVGRAHRIVPERTRLVIEERDRGCRVPGCDHTAWLQVHHIRHWLDGVPPTPGTWWRCAAIITGSTTRADSTSRATPMTPTDWSSPTARAEGSWAVADPHPPATP